MFKLFKNKYEKYYDYITYEDRKNKFGYNPKYSNQEEKLIELYGHCDNFNNKIKLIIIADTHGGLKEEFRDFINSHKDYDLCILLGDHSIGDIDTILKYIDKSKIYALLGNHDYNYIEQFGLNNLNGKVISFNGVHMLGIEGSYRYKDEEFPSFSQKESIEFLNDKEKVDILFSHDAPFEMSKMNDVAHQGLFGITYYLYKNRVPYCIHGHLHTTSAKKMLNGTKVDCYYMYNYVEIN